MKFLVILLGISVAAVAAGVAVSWKLDRHPHQSLVCFTASTATGTQWGNRVVTNPTRNPFVSPDDIEWMRSQILADTNLQACVIVSITPLR